MLKETPKITLSQLFVGITLVAMVLAKMRTTRLFDGWQILFSFCALGLIVHITTVVLKMRSSLRLVVAPLCTTIATTIIGSLFNPSISNPMVAFPTKVFVCLFVYYLTYSIFLELLIAVVYTYGRQTSAAFLRRRRVAALLNRKTFPD